MIYGQDVAIDALAAAIKMSRAGLGNDRRPVGSFLFAGPTGVGKTEVTRQLAIALGVEFLRFDMSEYMERHTVSRLIGAPPGYVGFDQGGLLTEAIAKQPHCVLLLDEIEKAHPDVFNLLLQVMDHGTLTDNNGRKADFRHVIIVMTTNAGAAEMSRASIGFTHQDHAPDGMEAVRRIFAPEFRNRLDAIIQFAPLDEVTIGARRGQAAARGRDAARTEIRAAVGGRRGASLDRGEGLRPEDGRAPDGARAAGAHQAPARGRTAVRLAGRRRRRARDARRRRREPGTRLPAGEVAGTTRPGLKRGRIPLRGRISTEKASAFSLPQQRGCVPF